MESAKNEFYATLTAYWTPEEVAIVREACDLCQGTSSAYEESEDVFYDRMHALFYSSGRSYKNFMLNFPRRLDIIKYTRLSWEYEQSKREEAFALWDNLYDAISNNTKKSTLLSEGDNKDKILICIVNAIYLLIFNYRYCEERAVEIEDYSILKNFLDSYEQVTNQGSKFAPELRLSYQSPNMRTQVPPIKSKAVIDDFFSEFRRYYKLRHSDEILLLPDAQLQLKVKQGSYVQQCIFRIVKILIAYNVLTKTVENMSRKVFVDKKGTPISVSQEGSYFVYLCLEAVGVLKREAYDKQSGIDIVKNRLKEIKDSEQNFGFKDISDIKYSILLDNCLSKYSQSRQASAVAETAEDNTLNVTSAKGTGAVASKDPNGEEKSDADKNKKADTEEEEDEKLSLNLQEEGSLQRKILHIK